MKFKPRVFDDPIIDGNKIIYTLEFIEHLYQREKSINDFFRSRLFFGIPTFVIFVYVKKLFLTDILLAVLCFVFMFTMIYWYFSNKFKIKNAFIIHEIEEIDETFLKISFIHKGIISLLDLKNVAYQTKYKNFLSISKFRIIIENTNQVIYLPDENSKPESKANDKSIELLTKYATIKDLRDDFRW